MIPGELESVKTAIEASPLQEFLVGARFHHLSPVQHQYPAGILDGRQAVGNDKDRTTFHEAIQGILYHPF